MRLLRAELLVLRKRAATYVVLGVLLLAMSAIYLLVGFTSSGVGGAESQFLRFPAAYGTIAQFVFGLGSLLAVAYAGAVAGGDWNWGIPRLVLSRGESRSRYVLTKAAALGIVLAVGVLISFAVGIVLTIVAASMSGSGFGDPIGGNGLRRLVESLGLGYPVLAERAAIGFAVATVLRSQVAGIIVGIVLYIGEGILAVIMIGIQMGSRFGQGFGFEPIGPEWFQFLPFSVGDSVLSAASSVSTSVEDMLLRPVPPEQALVAVLIYLFGALAISVLLVRRAEITA